MMRYQYTILAFLMIIIGFLSSVSIYYYRQSRLLSTKPDNNNFSAELPQISQPQDNVEAMTEPAQPKGRLSYPAHVYKVQPGDRLASIGAKLNIPWQKIYLANDLKNEHSLKTDQLLVIPRLAPTEFYRLNFKIDEAAITEKNRQLRYESSSDLFNPIEVAKTTATGYFGITSDDEFTIIESNSADGTALIEAKGKLRNRIGLFQPKVKGKNGLWVLLYIENYD